MAAVVTATMQPWTCRRCGRAGCTTLKNPAASAFSCAAMVVGATFDRCTIGTCGPAAYTSVCSPPYSSTTSSTTWAAASSDVSSSWYAEARAPHSRAVETADDAAAASDR